MTGEAKVSVPEPARVNTPFFSMRLANTGATPALDVVHWSNVKILDPKEEETLIPPKLEQKFFAAIGSGGFIVKTSWYRELTVEEIKDINSFKKAIFLFGRIEYKDIFMKKWHTNYRLRYNGPFPPPKDVLFYHCEGGNTAA